MTGMHWLAESVLLCYPVVLTNHAMNPLFKAAGEAVEEAILNCLTAAETMSGFEGNMAYALPLEVVYLLNDPHY